MKRNLENKGYDMELVSNWKGAYKSLAVWLPTITVLTSSLLNLAIQTDIVDSGTATVVQSALSTDSLGLAVFVFATGFVGRIIKQPKIGVK